MRMKRITLAVWPLLLLASCQSALAQAEWEVVNTFHIGGIGGWDYLTVDPQTHLLYVPRTTHTMVIDAQSGKKINPGTATMLELAALSLFHDVLCKAQAQGQVSPTQAGAQYAWYAAQVTRLGGSPLPPC